MNRTQFISILVLFFVSISTVAAKTEIAWYKSGMPAALQQAKTQNLPVFVYWGAVWCPPCNVVKSTIFKDPQFIQSTKHYIPVYLDGDTEEAQKWGTNLKVMGYPTLMILSPAGKEVLRLSPGNSIADLVSTMNYTKNVWNPVSEVLAQAISSDSIDPRKIQSLATYSWSQDKDVSDKADEYSAQLFQLEDKLKNTGLNKTRALIFMAALSIKLESLTEEQQLSKSDREKYKSRLEDILTTPELLKATMMSLAYSGDSLVKHLTENPEKNQTSERQSFINLYVYKMREYRNIKSLPFDRYYATFFPSIDLEENFDIKLEQDDKTQLTNYTSKTLPQTKDPKAREALVSDASYLLFKYGMQKQAKEMLESEIKITSNPHYLMSTLGYFEKQQGNPVKALEWYEKAYKAAKGPATKLQWYGSYVRNLIDLNPDDTQSIKSHVGTLLGKYTNMSDSFFGRNYRVLLSVKKSTNKWAKKNNETIWVETLKTQGLKRCSQSIKDIYKSGCEKFYQEFI
ncbi:MAG: thioredoxin family protein [Gammaproteobacteria bacterium]|nr:thioredoxin family protein [Gammaproteobacteria bacterium]